MIRLREGAANDAATIQVPVAGDADVNLADDGGVRPLRHARARDNHPIARSLRRQARRNAGKDRKHATQRA